MSLLTLRLDLRAPEGGAVTHGEQYAAALEQSAWADERGFASVVISEHHGVDDGYLPSPLVFGGAVAGRTNRVRILISALLVPLHDPLRLAEDIAVLDLASAGRLTVIAGLGYRPEEFEMFGVDRRRRGRLLDDHLEVMLQAWSGEPFEYRGRTVQVRPRPFRRPHPSLLVGGSSLPAAERAARLRLPFMPSIGDPALAAAYDEACAAVGFEDGYTLMPSGPGFVHVTEDPERDWERIGPYALHDAKSYAGWQTDGQRSQVTVYADTLDELMESGVYRVVTPDECVALAHDLGPLGALVLHPLMGGMPVDLGWESLELFESKVLPRLG